MSLCCVTTQGQQDDVGTFGDIVPELKQSMAACAKTKGQLGFCFSAGAGGGISSVGDGCNIGVGFGMDIQVLVAVKLVLRCSMFWF